jgi:SAM-dependent methyltransferase
MSVDPLRPLFEEFLHPGALIFEGGCGMGNYVAYYSGRGYNVVGLDFAQRALKTLSIRQPGLKLVGGDVSNLPFPDRTFDLYYSGGVVEHFESGAEESLQEARRVLKDDGILLISVPYHNPLRRILEPFKKSEWRRVERAKAESDGIEGKRFFQYAYRKDEFTRMLLEAGLETIKTQSYAVLWGIQELPFFNRNRSGEYSVGKNSAQASEPGYVDLREFVADRPRSLIKRLVVSEDDKVPVLGLGVKFMRWSAGNMMMYVCRRK